MRTILTILILTAFASAASAADAKAGQAPYEKACKSCHGVDGAPNLGVAKMMKVEMRDLRAPEVQATSMADMKKIITDGKGKMKPVASITGGAVDDVAAYVKAMKK
jgi:mono/diheme cytochrome c family protein